MNIPEDCRFRYAHGIVWDHELGQAVKRDDQAHVSGARVAALSAWTPRPRILHVYLLPDQQHVWQWEPKPSRRPFAH